MASFVYLGAPDETAHVLGCGATYEAAIRRADARLGGLLAAVRSRASYADEQWTFLVVTDHGHVDAGGHGGRTPEERTAWVAAAGPGIGPAPRPLRHADIAAQVFAALGRHPDRHWTLDGRPFAAAPHAVLLDMDGTLVDTESLWLRTVRDAVPRIGTDDLFDVLGRSATETATRLQPLTGGDPHTLATDLEARFLAAVQRETVPLPGAPRTPRPAPGVGHPGSARVRVVEAGLGRRTEDPGRRPVPHDGRRGGDTPHQAGRRPLPRRRPGPGGGPRRLPGGRGLAQGGGGG